MNPEEDTRIKVKNLRIINFIILLILLCSAVSAADRSLVLLTVSETGDTKIGGTANLDLEKKPGSGRIFIDSFPLTKLDTQISTRFANEIACQQLEKNCNRYDFFYTIRADTSIVGGPSAGLGIALLTGASLLNLDPITDVTVTGTINSGGIVGPVGGMYQKVYAAQEKKYQE